MGGSRYSDVVYRSTVGDDLTRGVNVFRYDSDIKSGLVENKVHDNLNPTKLNSAGMKVRECLDSDLFPEATPVAVIFDVTGSMGFVPKEFVKHLSKLIGLLTKKNYLTDPQVLFGAVGDATCDKIPLQLGQFEGGNEMDSDLTKIALEGGGGGQDTESYELAMYYLARHTTLDSVDNRGKKGYCFIFGDERPYNYIKRTEVSKVIEDSLQEDIPLADILGELREKFEVFWIMPNGTTHQNDVGVIEPLKALFGQNFLRLDQASDVCELIAATVGLAEGYDLNDVADTLKAVGASDASVGRTCESLAVYSSTAGAKLAKAVVVGGGLAVTEDSDDIVRL